MQPTPKLIETLNPERTSQLAENTSFRLMKSKPGSGGGNVISADDFVIADIGLHRDLAEFQYDIRGNEVFFRPLDGWWPESLRKAAEFRLLTAMGSCRSRAGIPYLDRMGGRYPKIQAFWASVKRLTPTLPDMAMSCANHPFWYSQYNIS